MLRRAGDLFAEHAEEISRLERPRGRRGPRRWPASRCTSRPRSATRRPRCPAAPLRRAAPERAAAAVAWPGGCPPAWSASSRRSTSRSSWASARSRRRWRSATPCSSSPTRARPSPAACPSRASSRRPACRRASCSCCPGGADVGEALVTRPARAGHLLHRLHGGRPPGRRAGRPAPQARPPRARRQLRAARARRRRRRPGGEPRRLGLVLPPGPDLHDHRPPPRRTTRSTTTSSSELAEKAGAPAGRRPGHRAGRPRPGHRRRAARQDPRPGHGERRRRARGSPPAATYDGLFYRPTVLADVPLGRTRVHRGDLRPGRAGHPVQQRGRGGRAGRATASTGSRSAS